MIFREKKQLLFTPLFKIFTPLFTPLFVFLLLFLAFHTPLFGVGGLAALFSVQNAVMPWSSGATIVPPLPMNHGLDPFPTVTMGPLRGQNNAVRGLRMGNIT